MEMLWTDPQEEPGRGPSKRGVGMQFGPDITKKFCENNGLEAVIRSHEVRMDGYEVQHDGKCITGMCYARVYFRCRQQLTRQPSSLLCTQVLRLDREQGSIHQHQVRLQTPI